MFKIQTWSRFLKEKHWDPKRKKFVANQQSFKSRAIRDYTLREFFHFLKKAKSDSTEFKRALSIANRCFEKYTSTEAEQGTRRHKQEKILRARRWEEANSTWS